MKNFLQYLQNFIRGRQEQDEYYSGSNQDYEYDENVIDTGDGAQRQLFTALDIGTAFAKAIIIEVVGDQAEVLGVGRHPQSYAHMSDGIVTDITGVIANCNEAL